MRRQLRVVAVVTALMFLALLVNANYVQVVHAGALRASPDNQRQIIDAYSRQRGPIIVGTGEIARSVSTGGQLRYLRRYADGPLYAPATGYLSLVYGATGIESAEDPVLSGTDSQLQSRQLGDILTGRAPQGGAVQLTLDARAQQAAFAGLHGRRGAVVALDPSTGAILALVSVPSYDPNPLASHDTATETSAWHRLLTDPGTPLVDRAISQTYPPGSLFKIVTAAAALSSGRYGLQTRVPSPTQLPLPQTSVKLVNFGGESCGNGVTDTLIDAFRISCNTAYGGIGMALGAAALGAQARRFGIGTAPAIPMPVAASAFPTNLNASQTAFSAIGQFDVRLTPLQAAMIGAAVADGGTVMRPYLVARTLAPDLTPLSVTRPRALGRAVSPTVAAQLTTMMETVVASGTGTAAQIPGVTVAGKTGTAQHGTGPNQPPPHAWFVAFAPAQHPKVAVAVIVENGGGLGSDATGGAVAAPIARSVIEAVLGR